jgi:phosphoglycolate phosphatase-like HAD superfamily hydrolase
MARAGELQVYPGITELLNGLHKAGHSLAIVTKSPDMVPKWFIKSYKWPISIVVGFHDVSRRKPDPEGLLLAMSRGKATAATTYHVGDQAQDTEAARGAKISAIGVTWGSFDNAELLASKPDNIFNSTADLEAFLKLKAP